MIATDESALSPHTSVPQNDLELQRYGLNRTWCDVARPEQLPPEGKWFAWLILAGRGFGKTRTGSETIIAWVRTGKSRRIALVGRTEQEIENVMIYGASGIITVSPESSRPVYKKKARMLEWPCGATAELFTDYTYERLRGPQFDSAWIDEFAKFRNITHIWEQLSFSLRVGNHPRMIITTTPRPKEFLKDLVNDPSVHVTRGSTLDNQNNLPRCFIEGIMRMYGDTALGRQEINAEFVESDSYVWNKNCIRHLPEGHVVPPMVRRIVAVDPSVTGGENADETGIISLGQDSDGRVWVLGDHSMRAQPSLWVQRVIDVARDIKADMIVAEVNNGGDLVKDLLHSMQVNIPVKSVRATTSKYVRASPVAMLYMQQRVIHACALPTLEKQMLAFHGDEQKKSPDRVDALVWGVRNLTIDADHTPTRKTARVWVAPFMRH